MRPTPERLRELLNYDPETGELRWRAFTDLARSRLSGKLVGTMHRDGYIAFRIDGHTRLTHRAIWAMMTGAWPTGDLDHINLKRVDNRWCNLRQATRRENRANTRATANNLLRVKGVGLLPHGRYRARLNGKHLGTYDTSKEANEAYECAAKRAFGEFARAA